MTPEQGFSHPFISKAVNELKCLRNTAEKAATGGAALGTQGSGAPDGANLNRVPH